LPCSTNLKGATLIDANLFRVNLNDANLFGTVLRGAKLGAANLNGVNLAEADLIDADLVAADLNDANLRGVDLYGADLTRANCVGANLIDARLFRAKLTEANLSGANLAEADLVETDLREANLSRAKLNSANLETATVVNANLTGADLTGCRIYGISAWDVATDEETKQTGLIITPDDQPAVMVDDLQVAQFIYLLLDREKIRNVIDTVTRKGVLLLGRFGDGGLILLQALAAWLRKPENGGYLPLLFDFPRPGSKTYTDTIKTLASLARFVIVDLSGRSVPQEITATVDLYEIPFVPVLDKERKDWSMFKDFLVKERVLEPVRFTDQHHLLELLADEVIAPAEKLIAKRQRRLDAIFGRAPKKSSSLLKRR
jgi:Pentapeptide repeats (8 copies)